MRINRDKLNCVNKETTIDITINNNPGLYFLFNEEYKLIYIGESKFPLSRILDHHSRSYEGSKTKKGVSNNIFFFISDPITLQIALLPPPGPKESKSVLRFEIA